MDVEAAFRQLPHDAVDILDIAADDRERAFQRLCEVAKLIIRVVLQHNIQLAVHQRARALGNHQDRRNDMLKYVHDQADQACQAQQAAQPRKPLHEIHGGIHIGDAFRL